jgi:hypothetical protein
MSELSPQCAPKRKPAMPTDPRVHTLKPLQRSPSNSIAAGTPRRTLQWPLGQTESDLPRRANQINFQGRRIACRTPKPAKVRAPKRRIREPIQADLGRPVLRRKIFRLARRANHRYLSARPALDKGRFAIVTNVGCGMRWTLRLQRRTEPKRTAKSCGPGAPTLASSFAELSAGRRWQKSPVTGESTK